MNFLEIFKNKSFLITLGISAVAAALILCVLFFFIKPTDKKETKKVSKPSSSVSQTDKDSSDTQKGEQEEEKEEKEKTLTVTSPAKTDVTTTESKYAIIGNCDPEYPLYLNGEQIEVAVDGSFAIDVNLAEGANSFVLKHKDVEQSYIIRYRYVIIQSCYPSSAKSYDGNSTFAVSVSARAGSKVTASFAGSTINLTRDTSNSISYNDTDFATFSGSFTMPAGEIKDKVIGKVSFNATYNSRSETANSANITCKKDVGLANKIYVAEVVAYQAETFNAAGTDDTSRPTNNYLPKGTVDYCDYNIVYGKEYSYYKLRCGRRIYINKNNPPDTSKATVSKRYEGTLPDHNELNLLSLGVEGRHTVMKLDTLWKAPFFLDILPQNYANAATQDYRITAATYTYVEIKFCYATLLNGEFTIPEDNPLFSSAEISSNQNGEQILRLYLKKKGGFYGWEAEYDSAGNLCFYFLNPAKVSYAENDYGTDLTGITIFVDVGHGGRDPGAIGSNKSHTEAERNLNIALKLKAKLENIGATVILSRTTDIAVSADAKCEMLRKTKPDYCIAIHHNSSNYSSPNGFAAFYSTPFSYEAAKLVNDRTSQAGIYRKIWDLDWHYYFAARVSTCPVVLTENGFMSNSDDYSNILNDNITNKKVNAMVQGIVDYFNLINR
ncbi:MAG: N-acetylmuramoyl-L-alanine amidase [Clostridia bacterium]|nr:N-acetylmuramoyl-L-alanine amidase [Clostridia bacterium]